MKVAKTQKNCKKYHIHHKKKLLRSKASSIAPAKTNAPFSQISSERLKLKKEKFTLHEVNLGGASKTSAMFYQ